MSTVNSISKNTLGSSLRTAQRASRAKAYSAEQLRTGKRVVSCKDDSSAVSISAGIKSRVVSYTEGARNINEAIAALEIARNALDSISANIAQMRAYTTRALTGMKSEEQIDSLGAFIQAGLENIDKTAEDAVFNGRNLFVDEHLKINPANEVMQASLQFKTMSTHSMGLKAQDTDAVFGAGFNAQEMLRNKCKVVTDANRPVSRAAFEISQEMEELALGMYNDKTKITNDNFKTFFDKIDELNALGLDFAAAYPNFCEKLDQLRQDCADLGEDVIQVELGRARINKSFRKLGVLTIDADGSTHNGMLRAPRLLHARWLATLILNEFKDSRKVKEEVEQYCLENENICRKLDDWLCNGPQNDPDKIAEYKEFVTRTVDEGVQKIKTYFQNVINAYRAGTENACRNYLATVEQSGQLAMLNGERFSQWADIFQTQIEQATDYVQSSMMELGISQRMLEEDLYALQSLSDASDEACVTLLDKDALEAQVDTVKNDAFLENCMTALQMMFTQIFDMQNLTGQLIDLLIEGPEPVSQ